MMVTMVVMPVPMTMTMSMSITMSMHLLPLELLPHIKSIFPIGHSTLPPHQAQSLSVQIERRPIAAVIVFGDVEELRPWEDVVEVLLNLVILREAKKVAGLHRQEVVDCGLAYAHHFWSFWSFLGLGF
ncbi:hypothetical protein EV2_040873 [Malus domestica]